MKVINMTDKKKGDVDVFLGLSLWFIMWFTVGVITERNRVSAAVLEEVEVTPIVKSEPIATAREVIEPVEFTPDKRAVHIKSYLESYGSPMPDIAYSIVDESDKHGVDPYVITAIFCQESSCGKACDSGNCTGYGIGDSRRYGKTRFVDSDEGIRFMIEAYAKNSRGYKACGNNIGCISKSGYNTRQSWVDNVSWFHSQLVNF